MTEISTNPQITHDDTTTPLQTEEEKLNRVAGEMAHKASKIQSSNESSINSDAGVGPGGGGIFSK